MNDPHGREISRLLSLKPDIQLMRVIAVVLLLIAGFAAIKSIALPAAKSPARPKVTLVPGSASTETITPRPTSTATPQPSNTPTTTPTPSPSVLDADGMRRVLRNAGWPERHIGAALRVAGCESGWERTARGSLGERGLFQIHPVHFDRVADEHSESTLFNPLTNAIVALEIWRESGWEPWSCTPAPE